MRILFPFIFGTLASAAMAGPHEGGTIVLHASSVAATNEYAPTCASEELTECEEAVTRTGAEETVLASVFAAFPIDAEPDLGGITFGISYDPTKVVVLDDGACGDFQLSEDDWPNPDTGTGISWFQPQHEFFLEVAWFALASTSAEASEFVLRSHPTMGAMFQATDLGSTLDPIADFGVLGFDSPGYLPCPDSPTPTLNRSWGGLKLLWRDERPSNTALQLSSPLVTPLVPSDAPRPTARVAAERPQR